MRRLAAAGLAGAALVAVVGVAIQFIPTGVELNPAVVQEPAWDSPRTRELAVQAGCMDCHSNETVWPWYGHVAPMSWLVAEHVADGRRHLILSERHVPQDDAHEAGEVVQEGEMPPPYYVPLHPSAALTDAEKEQLIAGLNATLGSEERGGGDGGGHAED